MPYLRTRDLDYLFSLVGEAASGGRINDPLDKTAKPRTPPPRAHGQS